MSEAKDILSLIICILAVYTASALFATGMYFILRKQWRNKTQPAGAADQQAYADTSGAKVIEEGKTIKWMSWGRCGKTWMKGCLRASIRCLKTPMLSGKLRWQKTRDEVLKEKADREAA